MYKKLKILHNKDLVSNQKAENRVSACEVVKLKEQELMLVDRDLECIVI